MKANFPVYAIVAMDEERAIGKDGGLAWHLPEDLKMFSALTKGHTVLMGRKTFDSLPPKFKPLPGRLNLVLSRQLEASEDGAKFFSSIENVIEFCNANLQGDCLWIIGGANIYQQSMNLVDKIYLTKVKGTHDGDVFFPQFEDQFSLAESKAGENCLFEVYDRK